MNRGTPGLTLALIHGRVYSGNKLETVCDALGVKGNKIAVVGTDESVNSACDEKTSIVNLNGRAVIPGFIDAHTHFIQMGVNALHLDLSQIKSLESLLAKVQRRCRQTRPGEWILGSGWDESQWSKRSYPTLHDLDPISSSNPVWLRRVDGHIGTANTLALKAARIPNSTRGFDHDHSGRPLGILREEAMEKMEIELQPDRNMMLRGLRKATRMAHRLGVTSIHDMADAEHIKLYEELAKQGKLRVRVYMNFYAPSLKEMISSGRRTGEGNSVLRLGGLKLFADGSIGAQTAALWQPYADDQKQDGMLIHAQSELTDLVRQAHKSGFQLAVHCIGERGIRAALDALEEGCGKQASGSSRHRLEHFELVEIEAVHRSKRLKLVLSMQPNYVDLWSRPGGLYEKRLGRRRLRSNNPFRKLLESGLPIAFGSDCMPFSPLYGIYSAVHAPLESQRLSVEDAVGCYTAGSAYASFEENAKGTIEEGKLADLVVLSADPFENPSSLATAKVDMTVFDGGVVYLRRSAADLRIRERN